MTFAAQITTKSDQKAFDLCDYGRKIRALPKNIISLAEKIILLALADHFGKNGKIYPSNDRIAEETALSKKTVLNSLSSLKKKNLINYPKQYNKKRRYIQLFDPVSKLLLVPKLSLVRDSTIPGEGCPYKNEPEERTKQQQQKPKKPPLKKQFVVADFKKLLREDLKADFNLKAYHILKSKNLTDGQIKTCILDLNNRQEKGIGWMINKVRGIEDIKTIIDYDKQQQKKNRIDAANKKTIEKRKSEIEKKHAEINNEILSKHDEYINHINSLTEEEKLNLWDGVKNSLPIRTQRRLNELDIDQRLMSPSIEMKVALKR